MQNNQTLDSSKNVKETKHDNENRRKKQTAFDAQIICSCKKKCAQNIDVLTQQETFEKFTKLKKWSAQTKFLRSLISTNPTKENLDPTIETKRRENQHIYHLINEHGSLTQVCLGFFTSLFQISRSKVFRAIKSSKKNPGAVDHRGGKKNRQTHLSDMNHLKQFISKFVGYESRYENSATSVANTKYFHPRLNLRRMYQMYSENCVFQHRKKIISETIFRRIFSSDFNLAPFRQSKQCRVCNPNKKADSF